MNLYKINNNFYLKLENITSINYLDHDIQNNVEICCGGFRFFVTKEEADKIILNIRLLLKLK